MRQQRLAGHGQRGQRVRRHPQRRAHVVPRRTQELAAQRGLRVGERQRVHQTVQLVHVLTELVGQPGQVVVVGHVDLEQRRHRIQLLDHPRRSGSSPGRSWRPRPWRLRACATRATWKPIDASRVGSGDQDGLAVEDAHQCPIPSPPSTGIRAPVM